jgi:phosphate-selective porin OprO/OprP
MKNLAKATICFFSLFFLFNNLALAEQNDHLELESLKKRLEILEKKIAAKSIEEKSDEIIVALSPMPSFKTSDGKRSFELNGRLQVDAGLVTKGKNSEINNQANLRRLFLGAIGKIDDDWNYNFLVGLENNQTNIQDAYLQYNGFKNNEILVGNFFENNGLDIVSGNLITPLMERSSGIATFRQFRRTGISINSYGKDWGTHFGIFGSAPKNPTSSAVNANNEGRSLSGRVHVAPINDAKNSEFLHLGFNSTYRELDSGENAVTGSNKTMRFSSFGDANILDTALIDSGNISDVGNYHQNMGEFRFQKKSFSLALEYIKTSINRTGENLNFYGGYLVASYFLTGEHYGYDSKRGAQTAANISNSGAWEIASRYSMTNLNSKSVRGGKLDSYNFGVNYYPNESVKLMLNYVLNETDSSAAITTNPQYLMFRAQVSF